MVSLPSFRGSSKAWLLVGLVLAPVVPGLSAQGTMVHTLEAFYNPSAVVALPDGRTLLVSNAARSDYGLVAGRGSISRVNLASDGQLSVDKLRFIEGLNGPVAMTLLATASDTLPANTLVVTEGGSWMVDAANKVLTDGPGAAGLALFNAATGELRGRIPLGAGSEFENVLGHPVGDPTSITSDPAGNLYLSDADGAATRSYRRREANVGIIKITRAALDAMARGEAPAANSMFFAVERNIATAVLYSTTDDALVWGTYGGELRKVAGGDLSGNTAVKTVSKKLSSITSLGLTPRGTVVGVSVGGLLFSVRGSGGREVKFRRETRFLSAGQPVIVRGAEGRDFIILPEQSGGGVGPWRQRVSVVGIPANL